MVLVRTTQVFGAPHSVANATEKEAPPYNTTKKTQARTTSHQQCVFFAFSCLVRASSRTTVLQSPLNVSIPPLSKQQKARPRITEKTGCALARKHNQNIPLFGSPATNLWPVALRPRVAPGLPLSERCPMHVTDRLAKRKSRGQEKNAKKCQAGAFSRAAGSAYSPCGV